jgi:alkyl hydroperoxide reductase subunit AhpF
MASNWQTDLGEGVKLALRKINEPIHMQVFTLPLCPNSPNMARAAYKFAFYNSNITADVIESIEFRELDTRYNVLETPETIINENLRIVGVATERELAERILSELHKKNDFFLLFSHRLR